MASKSKQTLILLLRLGIGSIFVIAGVGKLLDPASFLVEVSNYQILPDSCLSAITWFLPTLEIVVGSSLIFNWWLKEAGQILLGLILIFTLAILSAWFRDLNIECGCFGDLGDWGSYPVWIARNVMLAGGLIYLVSYTALDLD